jgi:CelD/BcsL family acetyltransferase involved in cellulose biosynthesis
MFVLVLTLSSFSFAQTAAEIKYDKERYEEKSKEIKAEIISDIVEALNLDAFKKQIVSQTIESYFEEITKIYRYDLPVFEKEDLVTQLDGRHFNDLKTILKQEQIDFILAQLKGDWKKDQKKKKKKKKRKKDN